MTRARTLADIADLNIDSNTLVIDASNNRVGIGVASPSRKLELNNGGTGNLVTFTDGVATNFTFKTDGNSVGTFGTEAGSTQLAFMVAGSEKVRIDGSGNVGFGTSSPSYRVQSVASSGSGIAGYFHNSAGSGNGTALIAKGGANNTGATFQVQDYNGNADFTVSGDGHATFSGLIKASDGSESAPSIVFSNDTNTGIYRKGGDKLGFVTGGVERMRITDLGRIEFEVPTNQTGSLQDQRIDWRNENNAGIMASIAVYREANGNAPAALVFRTSTNVDSASNSSDGEISEKARIDSNGNLIVGATTTNGPDGGNATGVVVAHNGRFYTSTNNGSNVFEFNVTGTGGVGTIHVNTSGTAYNTSSDYRLKENLADMTGAIARVKQLAPKRFNFIADPDDTKVDGFLAHEAQAVVPEAVTGTHNEVDDDGNAVMQGIDQSKLVPLLTGALQEAIAKIETLETKVAALEAGE